jgi:hypothetical protein
MTVDATEAETGAKLISWTLDCFCDEMGGDGTGEKESWHVTDGDADD